MSGHLATSVCYRRDCYKIFPSADFGGSAAGLEGYGKLRHGKEIERCTGIETRVVVLGHLQRGGSPTAFDRVLATRYGIAAIEAVHDSQFGRMVALQGNQIVTVLLKDVIGKRKMVNLELYEIAKVFSG